MDRHDTPDNLLTPRNIAAEIWRNLPIWFVLLQAIGLINIYMTNVEDEIYRQVGIPRGHFGLLILPAVCWFIMYYRVRMRLSERPFNRAKMTWYLLLTALGLPLFIWLLYTLLPGLRFPLSAQTLKVMFEYSNLGWAAVIILHTLVFQGFPRFVTFFGVAFLYGMMLENAGIYFGFFAEPGYRIYLPYFSSGPGFPAPLATMVGWCIVFTCCLWVVEFFRERTPVLKNSALLSSLLTTILALSMDGQLDPLASFPGFWWHWNELLPPWWYGVPFCNYAAWFGAFFAFSYIYFRVFENEMTGVWYKNWRLFIYVPSIAVFAGLLWFSVMMVWESLVPQIVDGREISYPTLVILRQTLTNFWPY